MIPLADVTLGTILKMFGGYLAFCILTPMVAVSVAYWLYQGASRLLGDDRFRKRGP